MKREDFDTSLYYTANPDRGKIYDGPEKTFIIDLIEKSEEQESFFRDSPLEDVIWVLIKFFKDKHPNTFGFTGWFGEDDTVEDDTEPFLILKSTKLLRKDITNVLWTFEKTDFDAGSHGIINYRFLSKLEIEFREALEESFITEALEGKEFDRTENGTDVTFTLTDSPISQIILDDKKFTMKLDSEKYEYYM